MDKLERIFEMQAAFNREIAETRHLERVTDDEWLQRFAMATFAELGEMLAGTNFKWWKNPKPTDAEYVKEEIVDILHFFVSLAIASGMDADELFRRYCLKNRENLDRQHGKSQKPGYDIHELES
ncbi:MAG: dUTPase [Clostridiales bacterium]|jgi:dimeric dUTPase (all-alpha-NTP-PPase superfamily)|nr:dUTPase [Clostridiales bacterium]